MVSGMDFEVEPLSIATAEPFRIARGTKTGANVFIVRLVVDGITGWGEAAPNAYYGESDLTVRSACNSIGRFLQGTPEQLQAQIYNPDAEIARFLAPHPSVRSALDTALWDIRGKVEDKPCYELFGANPSNTPLTSFTIGMDEPDVVDRKVDAAGEFKVLKIKMGQLGDMEMLDRILERSGKRVRVDANEGWDVEMALQKVQELSERNVEFVEQPISHEDADGLRTLKRLSPLPVILDESVVDPIDVPRTHDQGHGINIKLMKCGGLTPALHMIATARDLGLKVMLGCMLETSLGVTAAAHISPLVDYADLDGNLLLADDPFAGVKVVEGKLVLPTEPGLGVSRR